MNKKYSMITDIAFLNSYGKEKDAFINLFNNGIFSDENKWKTFTLTTEIPGLLDNIKARMKYFMSKMSLGVYNVLDIGPGQNIKEEDEIYLISGFTEIGSISKIGDLIMQNDYSINPSLFPNSVHHISLCYYTILKKIINYAAAKTDGIFTNFSFINFIKNSVKIDRNFIIVSGEEDASFFSHEEKKPLEIIPSFAAYKVVPFSERGFIYEGSVDSIMELKELEIYKESDSIFVDKETFRILKSETNKNIYTEYPIVKDNPCGVIFRLAFPFYFNCKGNSIVIEKIENKFYYFKVWL